ncbi:hypothetical protein [Sphingobacterium sp. MYb382]|uniref:hypothetical protein n=1 Tax=Sphingobacterium sp. MYb382 TaxID=2745278 RepID=UPI0030B3C097
MSFEAKVFKVLIASPGDVEEERIAIPQIISEWNNNNAETNSVVLLPVKWETHSAPLLGDRAQGIINNQIVTSCDMAVGVFWTRLGSPTGVSESGTAEEIEWFIENEKPVMLYFSSRSIDPNKLEIDQYKSLKDFEKKMRKVGLTGSYNNLADFKEQLLRQLTINVRNLLENNPVKKPTQKETTEKTKEIKKIIKENAIYIEDYEKNGQVKSFLVKGNTTSIKDELKDLGGKWNGGLNGWIFPISKKIEVAEFIKKSS